MEPDDPYVSASDGLDSGINLSGLAPGQRVGGGRFVLEQFLGRGGMGLVWRARDERLGAVVALKFLPSVIGSDAAALVNLRAETMRCQNLSHPNILRIHDLHESPGAEIFFSMEFVDGPTLNARRVQLPAGVFDWSELAPLASQLCDALDYAHGEKTIHRDLKPSNLLVDSKGRLKLADFGVARVVTEALTGQTGQSLKSGTLAYMSPQQLAGKTPRVTDDVYSLGATLFELLTSKPPFHSGDIGYQVLNLPAPPLAERLKELGLANDIPPHVQETILACLEKDPARRPQRAREVAERLQIASTRTASPSAPRRHVPSLRRAGLARTAASVVVVFALAAGWYWGVHLPNRKSAMLPNSGNVTRPVRGQHWENSLGMKFVPVGGFLMSVWETRVKDFEAFVLATGHDMSGAIDSLGTNGWTWPDPGYAQSPAHPAIGLKWHDVVAFCDWLTQRERASGWLTAQQRYRPPTEDEWQEALGGSAGRFPWGDKWPPPDLAGNYAGAEVQQNPQWPKSRDYLKDYRDEFATAAPVGSLPANGLGLHDLGGNVWEWCESSFDTDPSYQVLCGGGWDKGAAEFLQTSSRINRHVAYRSVQHGFRCVLALEPAPVRKKSLPPRLASEPLPRPVLTNSLGMYFVSMDQLFVSVWETRVQDFEAFVVATGYADAKRILSAWPGELLPAENNWKNPGFEQASNHPVVGVNAADALAFCRWLTRKEREAGLLQAAQSYRLPTDGEWDRLADQTHAKFVWGNDWPPPSRTGNFAGFESRGGPQRTKWGTLRGYDDAFVQTAPVGTFAPNRLGLFDLAGNVAEWCASGEGPGPRAIGLRGSSWNTSSIDYLQSSCRLEFPFPGHQVADAGFRCVLAPK